MTGAARPTRRPGPLARLGAALYDRLNGATERRFFGEWRRRLLESAEGRVLEVGAGTGANLPWYPSRSGLDLTLLEPSAAMLDRARGRAAQLGLPVRLVEGRAERLPFEDGSFDRVVFALSLCTIPDVQRALAEARRVLRPEGRLLALEHVRARDERLARRQDRVTPLWKLIGRGCHPNRDTRAAIEAAGFRFESVEEVLEERIPISIVRPHLMGSARKGA